MSFRHSLIGMTLMAALFGGSPIANAAAVDCSGPPGLRVLTVDPALVGGLCYTQNGNLTEADINGQGLDLLAKENVGGASEDPNDYLQFTSADGGLSGTWTIASAVWDLFNEVYLGFHFGGGGDDDESNPDSFIVQLAASDLTGTWSLGGAGAKLNGLSHIDLIVCQATAPDCEGGGGGGGGAPEPATGLLMAIGLGLLAGLRRFGARAARA